MGKVYLVGAGCGDPGLLSVKGKACIAQADCILYDRLIDPQLLNDAKAGCQLIYVGKENHHHSVAQRTIEEMLIEAAATYPITVRLKGGDPYVFGRGGEEALALQKAQIPFAIIPGISSAIGGLAYAGIPVTHRGLTNGFRVYTAHSQKDVMAELNFSELAKTTDTLIFLMGLRSVMEITSLLLQHGKAKTTPIAVCSSISMPTQHCVVKILDTLTQDDVACLSSPAIIVVGEVVKLREQLSFYEQSPLFGKRYLLMKLQKETQSSMDSLREAGALVQEVQCGSFHRLRPQWDATRLSAYSHIIFTSANAVQIFLQELEEARQDIRSLSGIVLCAIGNATAACLKTYHLHADRIPDVYDSAHMIALLKPELQPTHHILILKARNDHDELQTTLTQCCACDTLELYELQEQPIKDLAQIWDGILITCPFSARIMAEHIEDRSIPVYAIGTRTQTVLQEAGFQDIRKLKTADKALFAETIIKEAAYVSRQKITQER